MTRIVNPELYIDFYDPPRVRNMAMTGQDILDRTEPFPPQPALWRMDRAAVALDAAYREAGELLSEFDGLLPQTLHDARTRIRLAQQALVQATRDAGL